VSLYEYAGRLFRLWRYWLLALVAIGLVVTLFGGDLLAPAARTCARGPTYHSDVPASLRAELDQLQSLGLVYCSKTGSDISAIDDLVYWGSDGTRSILFFQPARMGEVTVSRYVFGGGFPPPPPGDGPASGYEPLTDDRWAPVSQAPDDASYYFRKDGAPADDDYAVTVDLTGPATENTSLSGRDFWRDLARLSDLVHRRSGTGQRLAAVHLPMPILPDRWLAVRARKVAPDLGEATGLLFEAAFAPQASGTGYEARFWADGESREQGREPDQVWPIELPAWPPEPRP
jgi:hypothetical protein